MKPKASFLRRHTYDILIAILAVLVLIVSSCDMQAELDERDEYCNMVKMGAWPDYREIYDTECLNKKDGRLHDRQSAEENAAGSVTF